MILGFFIGLMFVTPPEVYNAQRKNRELKEKISALNSTMNDYEFVLDDIENRDDHLYRVIFEAEPISNSVRRAGRGGRNRYLEYEKLADGELILALAKRIDEFSMRLYAQSKSFDEVQELAKNKEKMLQAVPSIQPVSNKDLRRIASGFGLRMHPVYHIKKMHTGLDFSAPKGTEVNVTGNGVVKSIGYKGGYGKTVVIDHGFGYKTLYAHLNDYNVKRGQKVTKGDVIAFVGNTGVSTGPHLHYEVIKGGKKVNPINYFFSDLTPEEYEKVIEIASKENKSL